MRRQRAPLSFPTQPVPREAEDFHRDCKDAHILSLLATSLINNSGLIFICVKIMNIVTIGEEISKLAV